MQERSVTGAAAHLGRTQSAVSHSLAKLRGARTRLIATRFSLCLSSRFSGSRIFL
ncbi:LysR family transcriptional regulator [Ensifer sp. WSM1721]|uniref:LysR family transcriptional regulator n=1 Tax=Ensifer sp. WSM1721 TaxID=1041159 RepID=UPI003525A20D